MKKSAKRSALLSDAVVAGYDISYDADGCTYISKGNGRNSRGIVIFTYGAAIRLGVDLTVCNAIRTYAGMRRALGLKVA